MIVSCGCTGMKENSTMRDISPPGTTPVTTITSGSGTSPLITPNETNVAKGNATPPAEHKTWLFSLEEAPQITTSPLFVPTRLPEGFIYRGGSLDSSGVVWFQIVNATTTVTYIQAPLWADAGSYLAGTPVQSLTIDSNGTRYVCNEAETLGHLAWTEGTHEFFLIGEPGCNELLPMAGSLEPLDYEVLDRLPHTIADPGDPYPVPERIRLVFSQAWVNARYPNKYHNPQIVFSLTRDEYDKTFSPDPRDPEILRHSAVKDDQPVVYLSLPRKMFEYFSVGPENITIDYRDDFFLFCTNMETLYESHWRDPPPPGWKPIDTKITTIPVVTVRI